MEFRLLGPVAAVDGGREVMFRQRRQRALLALLLLHLGETVSVDRLLEELWGSDAPRTALASLHNAVSQLRRIVGAEVLVTRTPGYALETTPTSLDTIRFEHLVAEAQAARSVQDHRTASVVLAEALALWRGPALADLAYEPFAQAEIRRLEELRQSALEGRLEADLARGLHEELVTEIERLVAAEPLRERLHGQLMLALYRSGRQADALAAYRAARKTLVDELGIEPGPELRQLEQAILRQDESLLLPGITTAPLQAMQFRRVATILFADVLAATDTGEELDPEIVHRLTAQYTDTAQAVFARHGGSLDKVAGHALMATFGARATDETHALRAARAALELQTSVVSLNAGFANLGARLEVRIGVAAGEVLVSTSPEGRQPLVTGEAVRVANGLQLAAAAGELVVDGLARRLLGSGMLEPLGELEVRGRAKPVTAFRLRGVQSDDAIVPGRRETPLVGRKRELRILRDTVRKARADAELQALCVLGPAGVGKSRLVRELRDRVKGFDVLVSRCLEYGEGVTYWPLRQLVGDDRESIRKRLGPIEDAEAIAGRLAGLTGSASEIAWAFRRWCEARAARRPLLLVVDDVHWGEPTFLDLLEYLAEHGRGPIVLVAVTRDDLLGERPRFLESGRIVLDALRAPDTETLVDDLLGGAPLSRESRAHILEAAEGNPLFLEQLVALATEGEPAGAERPLPVTIQALLAARLDRLGPGERAVLERASVVGRDFTTAEVTGLLDPEVAPTVARHLRSLERRSFVETRGESVFRFRHVLVQEATYRAAPKTLRAALHERLADDLDRGGQAPAPDVLVGTHLERAYQLRVELGPPDRAARRLAEDAGRRLGAAGIRASQREDGPAAVNLLGRACRLLPDSDRGRLALLCELGTAFKWVLDDTQSGSALEEASRLAEQAGERGLQLRAELERAWPGFVQGRITADQMLDVASESIRVFGLQNDNRGLSRAWHLRSAVALVRYQWATCADAAERALAHYVLTGFPTAGCLSMLAAAVAQGPEPVDVGIAHCEELAAQATSDTSGRAMVLLFVALLEAMRGRAAAARRVLGEAQELAESRGTRLAHDWTSVASTIEALSGDHARAEAILRGACHQLEGTADVAWYATFLTKLADTVYAQGRYDEALALARQAEATAPPDDLLAQTGWRQIGAKARARTGSHDEAEGLAREAVRLLEQTDALNERGSALVDLAEVLFLASRRDEAEAVIARALELLSAKGNVQGAAQAKARRSALRTVARV